MRALVIPALLVSGCVEVGGGESPREWYDRGTDYDVEEPLAFTDVNYDFTGPTAIADLPAVPTFATLFAPDDLPQASCNDWSSDPELPVEITGIVTLHPRLYFKSSGCQGADNIDEDERFYGSYFIQDRTGGYFVLGDSKVAHFDMGDRVTLRVRALRESFGQTMIAVQDVVEAVRGPEPIYYQTVSGALSNDMISRVVRVQGVVSTETSTFGELYLDVGGGERVHVVIDGELTRRGVGYDVGTVLQVTGPVLNGFGTATEEKLRVQVMRVGQLAEVGE
ncbi:MAG: hypothetical protein R3F59_32120 [Myxococcota bacterium]